MTDQPSSQSQPSMEDILASIRRIIDDEDVKPSAPASAVPSDPKPQESEPSFEVDENAAAQARAEYDAAMSETHTLSDSVDPSSESIFPQRAGALWRRVAGHPLSEGETDPLPADDTFELTETLEDDDSELELTELVDSARGSDPEDDARLLDDVAGTEPAETTGASGIGIGAITAAGVGAVGTAGAFAGSTMDRVTERMAKTESKSGAARQDDDDEEVLDLTRSIDSDASIDELASAMAENPRFESIEPPNAVTADVDDDVPMPVFERVEVALDTADSADPNDEGDLDRSFETAAISGLSADYSASLAGEGEDGDALERALDDRFYNADDFDDQPPEITDDYAASLGGEVNKLPRTEGAPKEDEMETVGGLVRDALRGRLPAAPVAEPDNTPLVSDGAENSAARSLATLARYDAHAPRRIYGGIKITDDDDSPTIEGMVQDTLRPMLRDWLNDNLPTLVENMVKQEVDRISARSRRFVRDDDE